MSKVSDCAGRRRQHQQLAALNRARCRRGRSLFRARSTEIWSVGPYTYRVPSQSGGGIYNVCLKPGSEDCTCPDFARYGRRADVEPGDFACKHLYAALMMKIKTGVEAALLQRAPRGGCVSGRNDSPIKVIAAGEKRPLAVVPSSVPQAHLLAGRCASQRPGAVLIIKRGEKVLGKVEPAENDAA